MYCWAESAAVRLCDAEFLNLAPTIPSGYKYPPYVISGKGSLVISYHLSSPSLSFPVAVMADVASGKPKSSLELYEQDAGNKPPFFLTRAEIKLLGIAGVSIAPYFRQGF